MFCICNCYNKHFGSVVFCSIFVSTKRKNFMKTLESKIELAKLTNQTVLISENNGIKCFVEPVSCSDKMRFFRVKNNITTIFKIA